MTAIKICGVTRPEDADLAAELGAWAVGINFWDQSPRSVPLDQAVELGSLLKRRTQVVGVFVNPTLEEVAKAVEDAHLNMVQLHGDEGVQFCSEVARKTGAKVIKAFPVASSADVHNAEAFRTDYHLFDTAAPSSIRGGTGQRFDWAHMANRQSEIPAILAGGINPENAAEAIEVARPFAIDVASGIESGPGVKDAVLMRALFEATGSREAVAEA
jgi:phosphoribosylanthranilate isomerase